jgi:hypothetical protein
MQITKILEKLKTKKFNFGKVEVSSIANTEARTQAEDSDEGNAMKNIIGKALNFYQIQFNESFTAIPYSKRELTDYLKKANIDTQKQETLLGLFKEIIETAESGNVAVKDDLLEVYFEFLNDLPNLTEEARKRIKYSIEQTVGIILIEGVAAGNILS